MWARWKGHRKDRCEPDGTALADSENIGEDLNGPSSTVDGYLLWQHDPALVTKDDGDTQWYCSEFSFLEGDPTYAVLREHLARIRAGIGVNALEVED